MTEHDAQPTADRDQALTAASQQAPRETGEDSARRDTRHDAAAPETGPDSAEHTAGHEDGAQVSTDVTPPGIPEAAIPELVIISGMSGAGRSTAAKCLEDLGWFVVDNLPPALIPTMVELGARSQGNVARIAVVVDVRGRRFF
ncbi:RNase adapter RapZ, partial [Streptomyces sp. NPDC052015]